MSERAPPAAAARPPPLASVVSRPRSASVNGFLRYYPLVARTSATSWLRGEVLCAAAILSSTPATGLVHGGEGVAAEHERGGRRRGWGRSGVAALARGHPAAQRRARGPPCAARQVPQRAARAVPHRPAARTTARHRRHCLLFLQVCRYRSSNVNELCITLKRKIAYRQ